jgi:hypothetical protein
MYDIGLDIHERSTSMEIVDLLGAPKGHTTQSVKETTAAPCVAFNVTHSCSRSRPGLFAKSRLIITAT